MNLEGQSNDLESVKQDYIAAWKEAAALFRSFSQDDAKAPLPEDQERYELLKTTTKELGEKLMEAGMDVRAIQQEAEMADRT